MLTVINKNFLALTDYTLDLRVKALLYTQQLVIGAIAEVC